MIGLRSMMDYNDGNITSNARISFETRESEVQVLDGDPDNSTVPE